MNNFEKVLSMTIDELAHWLVENGVQDNGEWDKWFDKTYCENCPVEHTYVEYLSRETDVSFCELNHYCRFFTSEEDTLDPEKRIKLWLQSEVKEN